MDKRLELLKNTELFVLDMDGTFYLGEGILPGALDFLSTVKEAGKDYLFFTNNSSICTPNNSLSASKCSTDGNINPLYQR